MFGKLSPSYIGSYEIIEKLNPITYRLDLPIDLKDVHNIFHISQHKKYIPNPNDAIIIEPIEVTGDLVYE